MTTTAQPPRPPQSLPPDRRPSQGGYVVLLVLGTLLGLVGLVVGGLAAASGWATFQQRDGRFLTTPTQRYAATSYALTTVEATVIVDDELPGSRPPIGRLLLQATPADPDRPVFVGIGPRAQVAAYLSGVEHTELIRVSFNPFQASYRTVAGTGAPEPPGSQPFWAASAQGAGLQSVEMDVQSGSWVAVVMNVDGSRGVAADMAGGARTELLGPITFGLTLGTLLLLAIAVALLIWGAAGLGRVASTTGLAAQSAAAPIYPARLTGELEPVSRWLWLVKWILVIPHLLILAVLWPVLVLTTIAAGVAILITGRYPRSLFNFSVGVLRWSWRVGFYGYSALGTDRYPPFTLARTDYPADFDVAYPERLSRGLVLVKSWLLALPHLIIVGLLTAPWYWVANGSPTDNNQSNAGISLLGVLVLVAALAMLFTNRYPRQLFDLVMGINRWVYRVTTYVALLRDEYPPFRLDQGVHEPDPPVDSTPPADDRDGTGAPAEEQPVIGSPPGDDDLM